MGRRKEDPEKAALRKVMEPYLKDNIANIKDGYDVNSIVKKYDFRNCRKRFG